MSAPRPLVHQPCAVCGEESAFRCSGCRLLHYCSKEHQRQDWKAGHRAHCKPFQIRTSEAVGRHVVAARDLPPGSLIMAEEPLVVAPKQWTPPICLGCLGPVGSSSPPCPRCGWPMCRDACSAAPAHQPECSYVQRRRCGSDGDGWKVRVREFNYCHPLYHSVSLLRCLHLRDHKAAQWHKFINLASHEEAREQRRKEGDDDDGEKVIKFTVSFFRLQEKDADDLRKIFGILLVNGHEVPRSNDQAGGPCFLAVYESASMLEHNCVANCTKRFTQYGEIEVRTTTLVSKGSRLSISYTDPLWGTVDRRKHLSLSKYFFCSCPRCEDPTELGTFIGAIKCRSCHNGYCVPVLNGHSSSEIKRLSSYEWICFGKPVADATRDRGCGNVISFDKAMDILEPIGMKLSALESDNLAATQEFLRLYCGNVLHKNHHFMTDARLGLVRALQQRLPVFDKINSTKEPPEAKLLELTCQDLLDVVEKMCPGMTEIRGVLLYELNVNYLSTILEKNGKIPFLNNATEGRLNVFREAVAALLCCATGSSSALRAKRGQQLLGAFERLHPTCNTTKSTS
ncbi:SET domain-containing protein SmydA-8-like [Ischnura elegans]|uniref:SET domain-containing protein SmydA-8-like n=1 Tax=Ischnura elegans TaxID=197161 RepID=UPI001ED8B688|nr:SET domain-containing protein SmydA-8-like [Ischnura elegans]